jgi:hypothetical protein
MGLLALQDAEAGKGALAARETVQKDCGRIEVRRCCALMPLLRAHKDSLRIRELQGFAQ